MAALGRAMGGGMEGMEDPMAMGAEEAPAGGDPSAELADIGMRLEALLPSLDPAIAEQIAPLLDVLRNAGQPKPEEVPQMGDMSGGPEAY